LVAELFESNAKILAACAAGIWVLTPEWLDQCEAKGKWVQEKRYWLINPKETPQAGCSPALEHMAGLAGRWYEHREGGDDTPGNGKAFSSWTVGWHATDALAGVFKRLLDAGGASFVTYVVRGILVWYIV
jgi:hypothetical protein